MIGGGKPTIRPLSHEDVRDRLAGSDLVVFDKDGTLIDFDAMWAGWVTELEGELGAALGRPVGAALSHALGYDVLTGRAIAGGPLAATPMGRLKAVTVETVAALLGPGRGTAAAEEVVDRAWHAPDPVALAHPLADLPALFGALRERGARIAVATSDDRAPTEATLRALGISGLVDAIACADDGLAVKPAPDAILTLCDRLGITPSGVAMVGDAAADLEMARAADAGLAIGVLSGVGTRADLEPLADAIVPSIAALVPGDRRSPADRPVRVEP